MKSFILTASVLAIVNTQEAKAQTFTFDQGKSKVGLLATKTYLGVADVPIKAIFKEFSGQFSLDPKNPKDLTKAKLTAHISACSYSSAAVDNGKLQNGLAPTRDREVTSRKDLLDCKSDGRSEISFVSDRIVMSPADPSKFEIHGDLTIKGVKKRVKLDAQKTGESKDPTGQLHMNFSASTSVIRDDFGVSGFPDKPFAPLVVNPEIKISLDVEGVQRAEAASAEAPAAPGGGMR